ncbi:hypothetical protein KKA23_01775 [Patescibacteria group bacterium]|nr:hypothetical protein [Patescibacteria group bacterium]MBU3923088.1 hypothetical protein [Patescibacteria group bacterium]
MENQIDGSGFQNAEILGMIEKAGGAIFSIPTSRMTKKEIVEFFISISDDIILKKSEKIIHVVARGSENAKRVFIEVQKNEKTAGKIDISVNKKEIEKMLKT